MSRAPFRLSSAALLVAFGQIPLALAADVTCYVDSVAGDDTKSGLAETDAVQSRANIPATCTIVRFKRGSVFQVASGEQVVPSMSSYTSKVKTITNYGGASLPLPKFTKARAANNGGMISSYQGGITIDGIAMGGSESDAQMQNLAQGIGVMLGANSKLINSDIFDCDIGIMTSGDGVLVQNNYIHDLHISVDAAPGVDPNVVGGAEGIFVNSSNVEVSYNSFVNCSTTAAWTGGDCDGGATEVTVGYAGMVSGVKIHHNFSYNSCGFFEVSSMFQPSGTTGPYVKGVFADSVFSYNVMIDSGWISLLQVNNTDLQNIKWENNTIVHHKGSTNAGIMAVVFTNTSSGVSGGSLAANSVFWTNNFWVFDGVNQVAPDKNFVQTTNLIITDTTKQNPGFVNLAGTTSAADFDLVASSPAINYGTVVSDLTLDYLNRAVPDPTSGKTDVGSFEYNSTQVSPPPATGGAGGSSAGTGGAAGTGDAAGTGGKPGTGGAVGTGGQASGGSAGGTGGVSGGGGVSAKGGSQGNGGSAGNGGGAAGSTVQGGTGGATSAAGGSGVGGSQTSSGAGGTSAIGSPPPQAGSRKSGCQCQQTSGQPGLVSLLSLLALAALVGRHGARVRGKGNRRSGV